ncbi:MAG: pirin family protein [Myxococcales bacterium]|nr:pirin family protein [Myxococcales bacterium]
MRISPLRAFPWETTDPFLFCVHHQDAYPAGNASLGPAVSLGGRQMGMDFGGKDGWSMYHGHIVPGFPQHPHRGFETVTVVRRGFVDHSDSLGATARYGEGDVQWLTAGEGIVHAEMFPLLHRDRPNPTELFQIWLNLPRRRKFAKPHFSMLWAPMIPTVRVVDDRGKTASVTLVAGALGDVKPPAPPPESWASEPEADVTIWTVRLEAGASFRLPAVKEGVERAVYFFDGSSLRAGETDVPPRSMIHEIPAEGLTLVAGEGEVELLVLGGRPIGEPVAHHGPFVMNEPAEIREAILDYQRTGFGGWPWPADDHVHPPDAGRHAKHPDGRIERPGT